MKYSGVLRDSPGGAFTRHSVAACLLFLLLAAAATLRAETHVFPAGALGSLLVQPQEQAKIRGVEIPDGTQPPRPGYYVRYEHHQLLYYFGPFESLGPALGTKHELDEARSIRINGNRAVFGSSKSTLIRVRGGPKPLRLPQRLSPSKPAPPSMPQSESESAPKPPEAPDLRQRLRIWLEHQGATSAQTQQLLSHFSELPVETRYNHLAIEDTLLLEIESADRTSVSVALREPSSGIILLQWVGAAIQTDVVLPNGKGQHSESRSITPPSSFEPRKIDHTTFQQSINSSIARDRGRVTRTRR